jgi:MFS family permease
MFGQAVGPVFGGIISQYLGYHAIFWFLFGGAAFALLLVIVFLPETLRPIAGNGSTCLKGIHRPLYYRFKPSPEHLIERNVPPRKKFTLSMIFTPFRLLLEKDVLAILASGSIVYAVWSMVTSSTTAIFQARFGLSDLQVGLVFLPNGVASMLGSYLTGRLSKHDFAVVERRYREQHGIQPDTPLRRSDLVDFPFARARLRSVWWLLAVFVTATALYGFSLDLKALAPPLILQFAISYAANSVFALNYLARCLVGAGGVAVVQVVVNAIGPGPAFAMWAGVAALAAPMLVLQWRNGARWAAERGERERRRTDVEKA